MPDDCKFGVMVFLADRMLQDSYAQPTKELVLADLGSGNTGRAARVTVMGDRDVAAGRRVRRAQSLVAPSLALQPVIAACSRIRTWPAL
jgi:hypothetical protein